MKRLVETDRWKDSWFIELHPNAKLLLSYLYDNCDDGGFIDLNYSLWSTQLNMQKDFIVTSLKALQSVLLSDTKKKLFIKDFLLHQKNLPLTKGVEKDDWIITKLKNNLSKFNDAPEIFNILDNHITDPNEIKTTKGRVSKKKTFVEPTFEELKAYYLKEKPDANLSAIEDIYDHYVGCGWVVGKNKPMVDWEACVRRAIRNEEKFSKSKTNYGSSENKKSRTEVILSVADRLKKNE